MFSVSSLLFLMHSVTDILFKPIFLNALSASLHFLLLLALSLSWVWNIIKFSAEPGEEDSREKDKPHNTNTLFKTNVLCSVALSGFSLILCLFNCFDWYTSGWSEPKNVVIVTLFGLSLKTLAWGVVSGFFYKGFLKFSFFFRGWCGFWLFVSCYSLVVDIAVLHGRPTQYLVSDSVSTCAGLFFCYMGYFVMNKDHVQQNEDSEGIRESLLNRDAKDTKGGDAVTPYARAGIFSILTFSWIGPLVAVRNEKTLDLEDVPQLYTENSVVGAFPCLREKLEADCGGANATNSVTTLKLVKSLLVSAWKKILFTACLAFLNSLASYVGPYLVDSFVQYLGGRRQYENQGYVLVSAFFFAKVVECLTHRHWFFRLQQIGIRSRAVLVTLIYNKALTLSCRSKQGHTSGEIINLMTVDAERVGDFSWYLHDLWLVALEVALALLILYKNLGLASIAALVATIIVMLANAPLGTLQEKYQSKLMESKDTRMKATSEIIRDMRILKFQGWEMKFL
ncbi:hypothetical protein Fmac_011228 [Flemingia macrophylla]|uniref:ABC transmembrane type-1 domain-containing protein n=1 Tax=Flemingia macrophylla TaxID=520843 RepID=A0ABD1MMM7_9FABA